MKKFTISNFSGGILESNNSDDFNGTTWGKLKGFVPRNSYTMESQWPIQSIGSSASTWTGNATELKLVYPLQSVSGIFLVALKEDGTVWWTKAPEANDAYTVANGCTWTKITQCENFGWDKNDNETAPNKIQITPNPDLRFITTLPLETYKFIKRPDVYDNPIDYTGNKLVHVNSGNTTTLTIDVSSQSNDMVEGDEIYVEITGSYSAYTGYKTITAVTDTTISYTSTHADQTVDPASIVIHASGKRANKSEYDTLVVNENYSKGIVSGVLMSSRRQYTSGVFGFTNGITAENHQSLIAYVDPTYNEVKVISFPNVRRWPQFKISNEIVVQYDVSGSSTTRYVTFTTQDTHQITTKSKIKVTGINTDVNGIYTVESVPSTTKIRVLAKSKKLSNSSGKIVNGKIDALNKPYTPIVPIVATNKKSTGETQSFISKFPRNNTLATYTITHKASAGSVVGGVVSNLMTVTVSTTPTSISVGDTITIAMTTPDKNFDGTYIVTAKSGNTITYRRDLAYYTYPSGLATTSSAGTLTKPVTNGYPNSENFGHPYTWLDEYLTLHPGTGFIPRGNIGTMWGAHLIIGDIEYRNDAASTVHTSKKLKADTNQALLGSASNSDLLRDENTSANRNSFYYSDNDIDEFNPISVFVAGGTDTRIVGMHQLANKLVVITTSGGQNDGVIVYSGLLSKLHPYNPGTVADPQAVRRQVVKGGIGPADFADNSHYDVSQTCLWPDASLVCFIDKRGGIYATNSETVQRLDNFGPRTPRGSSPEDWVAANGKNLLVWSKSNYAAETGANSYRLLCFTMMTSDSGVASGAWTELVGPAEIDGSGNYLLYNLKSVYGCGSEFYGIVTYYQNINGEQGDIVKSKVIRFAIAGPENEKGCSDGNKLILSVATPPIGQSDSFNKIHWDKIGISFYTKTGAQLAGAIVKGASAMESQINIVNTAGDTLKNFPQYTNIRVDGSGNLNPRTYPIGLHNVLFPAGIGTTPVISAEWLLMGDVRLESLSLMYAGVLNNYGEDVASEQ